MFVMSLNQAIKSASTVEKTWNYLGGNENKQLCDHKGGGKGWMADKNRQKEIYVFIFSLWSNGQNFNFTKSTLLNSLATVDILPDFRSYLYLYASDPLPYLLLGSTLLIIRYSSLMSW